jgi:hypothetical protein
MQRQTGTLLILSAGVKVARRHRGLLLRPVFLATRILRRVQRVTLNVLRRTPLTPKLEGLRALTSEAV